MSLSFKEAKHLALEKIKTVGDSSQEYEELVKQIKSYSNASKTTHSTKVRPLRATLEHKPLTITLATLQNNLIKAENRKRLNLLKTELKHQITLISILSYLHYTRIIVKRKQFMKERVRLEIIAAKRITKWYRNVLLKRNNTRKIWAIAILLPALLKFGLNRRLVKKRNYAIIAYSYIQDVHKGGILISLVHAYQAKVYNCQKIIRAFLCRNRGKLEIRTHQVELFKKKNLKKRLKSSSISLKLNQQSFISDLIRAERKARKSRLLFSDEDLMEYFG